jgi:hypothetical protein
MFRFEGDVRNIVYADAEDSRPKHQNMMAYKVSDLGLKKRRALFFDIFLDVPLNLQASIFFSR